MTHTPNADLVAHARELGLTLTVRGAQKMRAGRGEQAARDRVEAIASLIDLASALGRTLTLLAGARRLDAAGDYDGASTALIAEVRARRNRVFDREWERLEAELYANDAHARHATLLGQLAGGSLGWRTTMLLMAAHDAGLQAPNADAYQAKVVAMVGAEIERRYPIRREEEWQVVDPDSHHPKVLERAILDERQARDMVLKRVPELQQRIDELSASSRLRSDIERLLGQIQKRLTQQVDDGCWHPNPDRYRREVADAAADAARAA
jgi:hypothetical protein